MRKFKCQLIEATLSDYTNVRCCHQIFGIAIYNEVVEAKTQRCMKFGSYGIDKHSGCCNVGQSITNLDIEYHMKQTVTIILDRQRVRRVHIIKCSELGYLLWDMR